MNRPFAQWSGEELKRTLKEINEELQRRANEANTTALVCPVVQIGQEVEDMIVIRVNPEGGTFIGRDSKGIEWECEIKDYFEIPSNERVIDKLSESLSEQVVKESGIPGEFYNNKHAVNTIKDGDTGLEGNLLIESKASRAKNSSELINLPNKDLIQRERGIIPIAVIRPPGSIRGVPQKTMFPLKTEVKINLKKDAGLVLRYEAGIKALIQEMRHKGASSKQIVLEDGKKVTLDGREVGYQFPYDGEAELFEGARAIASIYGTESIGRIVAVMEKQIIISFLEDFGPVISCCVLRVDNTAMLEALRERLEKISNGEITSFNNRLAQAVINNEGDEVLGSPISESITESLNLRQTEVVSKVLSNEVFYIWGPPGTGKTKTLGVLNRLLFEKNKRILLCSNTNQAVDQVLLSLCKSFDEKKPSVLEDGKIVRVGKISHKSLDRWSNNITIDGIVDRKSAFLKKRKGDLEIQLDKVNRNIYDIVKVLNEFKKIDESIKDVSIQNNSYANERKNLNHLLEQEKIVKNRSKSLEREKQEHLTASRLKRVFLRSKETIEQEIFNNNTTAVALKAQVDNSEVFIRRIKESIDRTLLEINPLQASLESYDRKTLEKQLSDTEKEKQSLINEISDINKQIDDIAKTVLLEARIVGATVTKTFLSPQFFEGFDVVIVDEASMVILPSLFYVAGMAKEKVIISGDPFQLPPIIQTEQEDIYNAVGGDVFTVAGVLNSKKRVTMLQEQYRMSDDICKLISSRIYQGELYTGSTRTPDGGYKTPPEPFNDVLTLVDTSTIWPFDSRDPFKSRYNLMNALAIRNLCRFLEKVGYINSESQVGVCTPYAAQSKVLRRVIANDGLGDKIEAGTVHRYQGDEKTIIILDIPDSWGDQNAGIFLQADNRLDNGAKLFNVAVSRSKEHLIAFANLAFLDRKLPQHAILRGILADMQLHGTVIDVRDILSLWPVTQELRKYGQTFDLSTETLETGLFNEKDFYVVCSADIERAKKSVVIFSGFITPQRVASYESLIRRKIDEGVVIRCVTRPPDCNGNIPEENGIIALDALENWGCIVDTRASLHEKVVVIDEQIVWFGSLNPLSHTSKTNEVMARIEGDFLAHQLGDFLSLNRSLRKDYRGTLSQGENPRCPKCNSRTSYRLGKYGPYWKCERCEWRESLKNTRKMEHKLTEVEAPPCPLCGGRTIPKAGKHGDFYSCSNFPLCKGAVSARARKKSGKNSEVKQKEIDKLR